MHLHGLHMLCTALSDDRYSEDEDVFDGVKRVIEEKGLRNVFRDFHWIIMHLVMKTRRKPLASFELDVVNHIQDRVAQVIEICENFPSPKNSTHVS